VDRAESSSHEVLRDEIIADAERQAERLVRKAQREAKILVDRAVGECDQQCQEKLEAAQAAAQRQRMLTLATVPVEIGRLRATRTEQELTALRDAVREQLSARAGFDYRQCLLALAAEAMAQMEGEAFVLQLAKGDVKEHGPWLASTAPARAGRPDVTVTIDATPTSIRGGVIVRDLQGRQIWDNSFEARLYRLWPLLRHQMAEHLGLETTTQPAGGPS
jgi:vacuolar-type H+-ATPase subunit E/Vma4